MEELDFYEVTGGMTPSDIGMSIKRASNFANIADLSAVDFVNAPKLDRDWVSTGADVTPTINTESAIASGVTIGYDEPTKYQLQGFPRDLLTVASGHIIGSFPSGEVSTKHRSFYYTGQTFEVKYRDLSGGSLKIYVDGVLRSEITAGNANAPRWALIDLGSAANTNYARRIDIVCRYEYWGGVVLEPNTTIFPTRDKNPRIAVVGDSITQGTGSNGISWAKAAGMMLNCPDLYVFGIGGSGYINNGQAAAGVGEFINRLQNITDQSPDYVVIAGGINDQAATDASFKAAVDEYYAELLTHFMKEQIIICSPFNPGNSAEKILSFRSILEDKALEIGCQFVDFISPDGLEGVFTGTGDSSAKTGDGNADIYISSDGIHPNQSGHNHIGRFFARQFYKSA